MLRYKLVGRSEEKWQVVRRRCTWDGFIISKDIKEMGRENVEGITLTDSVS
jgi:hypothetical protein